MIRALLCMLLSLAAIHAGAQAYPSKPIRVIVPFPVGGIADIYTRIIGAKVAESWGQPVLVENRTGAGGNIGADIVAKSPPDGYTIGIGSVGTHAVNVSLFSKLPYDPVADFAPIALVAEADALLVVHPSVPARNVAELIALARARPGALSFASAGPGTTSHLAGELFKSMAKVDMLHVPYKGNTPAITDLLAGQTSLLFADRAAARQGGQAGRAGELQRAACRGHAGAAHRRGDAARLRRGELGRPVRAGEDAGGRGRAVEPRGAARHAGAGNARAPGRRGRAFRAHEPAAVRRLREGRDCPLDADRQGLRRQSRIGIEKQIL